MNPGQNQHWWTCCSGARTCAVQDTAKARSAQAGHAAHTLAPTHWHPHSHAHTVHTQGKTQPMLWRAHTHTHTEPTHWHPHSHAHTAQTPGKNTAQALVRTHTYCPHTGTHTQQACDLCTLSRMSSDSLASVHVTPTQIFPYPCAPFSTPECADCPLLFFAVAASGSSDICKHPK